jgi:hypothetical protein
VAAVSAGFRRNSRVEERQQIVELGGERDDQGELVG